MKDKFDTIDIELKDARGEILVWNIDVANSCREKFNTCCSKLMFASSKMSTISIPNGSTIDKSKISVIKTGIDNIAKELLSNKNALLRKVEELENAERLSGDRVGILDQYDQKAEDVINDIFDRYFYDGETLEKIAVSNYNQLEYPELPYGRNTVQKGGCGISCLAGMFTEYLEDIITPADLARDYDGDPVNGGTTDEQMVQIAADYGFSTEICFWGEAWGEGRVMEALANGQQVILCVSNCDFTTGGHYIRLTGLTEDGKIMVHDPNGANWDSSQKLIDGFANGFTPEFMARQPGTAFIFEQNSTEGAKEVPEIEKGNPNKEEPQFEQLAKD